MIITKATLFSLGGKLTKHFYAAILLTTTSLISVSVSADQVIQDDLVVTGSLCTGTDCVNGENFGFDTLRLKENNLRIKFMDTSSSSSFPNGDWQITINDTVNGGLNYFKIEDIDAGTAPFTINAGASNNSLFIAKRGNVGFGTNTPLVDVNVKTGNSPTLRLEQDKNAGFAEQSWDVGGNETNFFIRDVTNSSALPFRIVSGASNNALYIAASGNIGFETSTPDGLLDIAHPADANNHAVLVSPTGGFGINVDNGFAPTGLLDVQTTGGVSRLLVNNDGNVVISKDLTVTGTLNATLPNPAGFSELTATKVTTAQDMTVTGDLVVNGATVTQNIAATGTIIATGGITGSNVCTVAGNCLDALAASLGSGGGGAPSSRAIKDVISEIDKSEVLNKVSALYVSRWSYKKDDNAIQHIGPMAEDFHEAFGLNGDVTDKIAYIDIIGVSMAAIQALNSQLKAQAAEITVLKQEKDAEIALLKNDIAEIKHLLKIQNSLNSK